MGLPKYYRIVGFGKGSYSKVNVSVTKCIWWKWPVKDAACCSFFFFFNRDRAFGIESMFRFSLAFRFIWMELLCHYSPFYEMKFHVTSVTPRRYPMCQNSVGNKLQVIREYCEKENLSGVNLLNVETVLMKITDGLKLTIKN